VTLLKHFFQASNLEQATKTIQLHGAPETLFMPRLYIAEFFMRISFV